MRLLAADIGGTKTLFALAEAGTSGRITVIRQERFASADYATFESMIDDFLAGEGGVAGACLAVAGPIDADGTSALVTNVGWRIDARALESRFGIPAVRLINDFQAQAWAIDGLEPEDLHVLQPGTPQPRAMRTVVGAGTGLGVGHLVWEENAGYVAHASEGGHSDFGPNGALQRDLLAWLSELHGAHVSVERILSGPGLASIYRFLAMRHADKARPEVERAMAEGDAAAVVSGLAMTGGDRLAREALDLFVSMYGAFAGSLALITLPYGGMYIAGGIAPRIIDAIVGQDRFMTAFNDKGRMARLTAAIPVSVVMNPSAGLLGALRVARVASLIS